MSAPTPRFGPPGPEEHWQRLEGALRELPVEVRA